MASPADDAAFLTRNAAGALPAGGLERRLADAVRAGRPLRVKLGLDPTAPDIHLGHTVVLQKLREFQDLGHRVVLIVGDFTARVGDPSGRSSTRPVLSGAEIEANARTYQEQALRVLSDDPSRYELRFNGEWLDMGMEELFRLARTTTLAQLLERDDFARRHEADLPISILELLYPLLQGYDSVAVRADVELGGTDQTFNLLLARDVQRAYGIPEQVVLTVPILPGTDGAEKMSKSVGNHVGITEPPEEMFGKTMSLPDGAMGTWFDLLAVGPPPAGTPPRDAKRALARALVERFHGAGAAASAEAHFDRLHLRREAPDEMPELEVGLGDDPAADPRRGAGLDRGAGPHRGAGGGLVHLPALLAEGFGLSRSEARRLLAQGGVRLDGEPLGGDELDVAAERLDGRVLQVGRRQFRRLRLAP